MNRTQSTVLRMAAFLLLSGVFLAQFAGISHLQKLVNGADRPVLLQADGPFPPPPPTPIKPSQS